jgi:hypothetical protein
LLVFWLVSSCAAPVAPASVAPAATTIPNRSNYRGIPTGFDFPADQETLLRFRDTQNVVEMRRHAWYVWAGLTQPAPGGEAIWETWYSIDETFDPTPETVAVESEEIQRDFITPRQFTDPTGATPQAIGESLLSFVLFNDIARAFIITEGLNRTAKLTEINTQMTADGTPVEERRIKDFPPDAVALKTSWWAIKGEGLTVLPVWDFEPQHTLSEVGDWTSYRCMDPGFNIPNPDCSNGHRTWKRVVAVDPSRQVIPIGETTAITVDGELRTGINVVPLSSIYHFKVETPDQLQALLEAPTDTGFALGRDPQIGDYVALVGFHYTTKEIPDWVWSTFWWHDKPDEGPYSQDRPNAVTGVWRNYLMDTAYSMKTPREFDGTPNSVYNPWLEARFPNGVSSNCMTCHQRSVWSDGGPVAFWPITTGGLPTNDAYFEDALQLDFLWSVGYEAK